MGLGATACPKKKAPAPAPNTGSYQLDGRTTKCQAWVVMHHNQFNDIMEGHLTSQNGAQGGSEDL